MKPSWTEYFLLLACQASIRSIDPSCKCGCVITSSDNIILGVGYNGPVADLDDSKVPLTRPEKYKYFRHSERNALDNCFQHPVGGKAYVTGRMCLDCTQSLYQAKITEVFYTDCSNAKMMVPEMIAEIDEFLTWIKRPFQLNFIPFKNIEHLCIATMKHSQSQ